VDTLLANGLMALGRSTAFAALKIVMVVLGIALELVLIPIFQQRSGNGGLGVAVSFAACETMVFAGLLLLMPRGTIGPSLLLDCGRALGAALLTAGVLALAGGAPPWVGIPLCVAVYAAAAFALGLLRPGDLRLLGSIVGVRQAQSPVDLETGETRRASSS
jgi:hypothetical protein